MSDIAIMNLETLPPGEWLHLKPEWRKWRVCTVIDGKVEVRSQDGTPFMSIGVCGFFPIEPGLSFWVRNNAYYAALLLRHNGPGPIGLTLELDVTVGSRCVSLEGGCLVCSYII